MNRIIEYDCKCASCKGTGLYVGMAERNGAAVVCHTCDGAGRRHVVIEYEDPEPLERKAAVSRVFETNPGIVIGNGKEGEYQLSDFGGMPYDDWFNGKAFPAKSENRRFTCPRWWYQSADYKKAPEWDECYCSLGSTFSSCTYFKTKERCWARWDAENGGVS